MVSLARWRYILPAVNLPDKLQLLVAAHVAAPRDRAALCIPAPPLGHKAIKAIPASYKGPLMSLSNRVLSGGAVGEAEVRRHGIRRHGHPTASGGTASPTHSTR